MKSKMFKELKQLDKTLSTNSWTVYRSVLGRLLAETDVFPQRDQLMGALRNQNVDRLLDIADDMVAQKYATATEHFVAHQFASLIRKYPFPTNLGVFDPEKKAREKFHAAEAHCASTNEKLRGVISPDLSVNLAKMRDFISYVLGEQDIDLTSWYEQCDFGPGASLGVNGNASNVKRKIASRWTVTPGAMAYGFAAFSHDWNLLRSFARDDLPITRIYHDETLLPEAPLCMDGDQLYNRFQRECDVVSYNKIAFAPKTTRVHRTIAVEPLVNGFLQKGLDSIMRDKLKRIRLDLSDQTRNSRAAYYGSLCDVPEGAVTIDLSSASDSVSIELCRAVLPYDWFRILNSVRSVDYMLDNEIKRYEKFASMGNGFCFPLETLIFAAAANAVGCGQAGTDYLVYGDDIVIRQKHAADLISLLNEIGFQVNENKTFLSGPFRESCGADWFLGKDVRPFILDFALDSVSNVFKFLNLTKRSAITRAFFASGEGFVLNLLPFQYQLRRPHKGPADTGIDSELDEFMSSKYAKWSKDLQCWSWKELHHKPVEDDEPERRATYALMLTAIRGATANMPFTYRRKTRAALRRVAHG